MRILVTGGAGCIGSDLVEALLLRGDDVTALDNLSSGTTAHLARVIDRPRFTFIEGDALDTATVDSAVVGQEMVYHLAGNPDVKFSPGTPTDTDIQQNLMTTHTILEAMRRRGVTRIAFASTSAVYGTTDGRPIREDHPLQPISLYAASKAAAESLMSAFHGLFGMECWVFRFANIIGPKVRTRGRTVISDFVHRLREEPGRLTILGNGQQAKSYLLAHECVEGMIHMVDRANGGFNVFNLGGRDTISVGRIADMVVEALGLRDVEYAFTGGEGGWPGDVPRFLLDVSAAAALGWTAKLNSEQSVAATIAAMLQANACRSTR